MRFTVIWTKAAMDDLADLWNNSQYRNAIASAQHTIDRILAVNPHDQGSEFYGDRILVVWPLQVIYSISDLDMQVIITSVW